VADRVTALRGKGRAREPSICMFGRLGWTASRVAPEGSFWAVADYLGSTLAASSCERLPGPIAVADSAPRPGGSPGGSYGTAPPATPADCGVPAEGSLIGHRVSEQPMDSRPSYM
jgi:hypothetical protein